MKEITGLQPKIRRQILGKLVELEKNSHPQDSKALKGEEDAYRVDSGEYRISYHIDKKSRVITVFRVRHRKDVYRGL